MRECDREAWVRLGMGERRQGQKGCAAKGEDTVSLIHPPPIHAPPARIPDSPGEGGWQTKEGRYV